MASYSSVLYSITMIVARRGAALFHPLCTLTNTYGYIRKKELDQIEKAHGRTASQLMIMYSKMAKYIYLCGWTALKKDARTYLSLKKKEKGGEELLTKEEQRLKKHMWKEVERLKTLAIIQILPFSGPLLLYYLYVYPTSIPSWFSVDVLHDDYLLACIKTQSQAVEHYKKHPLHRPLNLMHLKLEELKRLSELLFGHFEDGVTGYNKIMAPKRKEYFLHPSVSKYLVVRNLKKQFKGDLLQHPQLKGKSAQQLVLWKYDRVMEGTCRIQFEPLHEQHGQHTPVQEKK